jgi:hypothetical protein
MNTCDFPDCKELVTDICPSCNDKNCYRHYSKWHLTKFDCQICRGSFCKAEIQETPRVSLLYKNGQTTRIIDQSPYPKCFKCHFKNAFIFEDSSDDELLDHSS